LKYSPLYTNQHNSSCGGAVIVPLVRRDKLALQVWLQYWGVEWEEINHNQSINWHESQFCFDFFFKYIHIYIFYGQRVDGIWTSCDSLLGNLLESMHIKIKRYWKEFLMINDTLIYSSRNNNTSLIVNILQNSKDFFFDIVRRNSAYCYAIGTKRQSS
jgi:hypothetical protein